MLKRLFMSVVLLLFSATIVHGEMASINKSKVNMRTGPGENYAILWELGKGYPLKILEKKDDWHKVADFEDDQGWIHKSLLSKQPHLIVKKKIINVRSGPGKQYKVVGKANYGVVFKTLNTTNAWVEVKHENGLTGWVLRSLLWGW
ncbi:MAG: SH3 domain-containing protein [Proteobacteria bacterium]|nr:SH3 domain-containing protein [Pseudomonadota bacterium]MBU1708770.1 SH3 domain-containing protein [Pseudomonadota bacterium]